MIKMYTMGVLLRIDLVRGELCNVIMKGFLSQNIIESKSRSLY